MAVAIFQNAALSHGRCHPFGQGLPIQPHVSTAEGAHEKQVLLFEVNPGQQVVRLVPDGHEEGPLTVEERFRAGCSDQAANGAFIRRTQVQGLGHVG